MGKKFRVRIGAAHGRRIPKGGSSSSNPTTTRHRDAAKASRLVARAPLVAVDDQPDLPGPSDAVMQQLPIGSMQLGADKDEAQLESRSMVSEGGLTHITQFTNCTNPTFDAVHREWRSGSKLHEDVVAVLAAVAEIIQQNNGSETDVEYFAALLTALEGTDAQDTHKIAAIAYLLHLIVKKVAKEVHVKYFARSSRIILDKLMNLADSDEAATALKFLISSMGGILRSQTISTWSFSSNTALLTGIATFSTHDKPWVRTMSRRVLRAVLTDPVSSLDNGTHPAAKSVGQYVLTALRSAEGPNASTAITRLLCLLEGVMHKMPEATFKELAEFILRLGAVADPMVRCAAFQCTYRVLQRQPSDASLPTPTNTQLVLALREFPVPTDVAVCAYWLQALAEAHVCLAAKEQSRSVDLLGETLDICGKLFARGDERLGETVHFVLVRTIENCIQQNPAAAIKCLEVLDSSLTIQNTSVWKLILKTMSSLFTEAQTAVLGDVFERTMRTLADLREKDDCFCVAEIEEVFASATSSVGVFHVLSVVNLGIDPDAPVLPTDFRRSWLLPVLKNSIRNAPLSLFMRYFLGMSVKLHARIAALQPLPAKLYSTVESQLWGLLPSFLSTPTDFQEAFPTLAPILGAALNERPDLRLTVLASIRAALKFASEPDAPERAEIMARFAKNFLPILFTIYSTVAPQDSPKNGSHEDMSVKLAALETIRMYIPKAPRPLLAGFVKSAIEKISDDDANNPLVKKSLITDILIAMAKGAQVDALLAMFAAIQDWFSSKEPALQKKAYRLLGEIYRRINEEAVRPFFEENAKFVTALIAAGMQNVVPSAWSARLGIYRSILTSLTDYPSTHTFCESICEQVILCLDKSNSHIVRAQALKCFQEMCSVLLQFGSDANVSPSDSLDMVLNVIYRMANPATEDGVKSKEVPLPTARSTLIAMNIVAQKYLRLLNACLLSKFVGHACSSIGDTRGPIRLLAIRLIRVLCTHLHDYALLQYKELILNAVFGSQSASESSSRVRKSNRLLFEVLIEKFGRESLDQYAATQEGWVKLLRSVDRMLRRRAARQAGGSSGPSRTSMSETDEATTVSGMSGAKTAKADSIFNLLEDSDQETERESHVEADRRSHSVWIREGDEEDLVDLLDRKSILDKITTTQPKPAKSSVGTTGKIPLNGTGGKPKEVGGFRVTKDGRLIIQDIDELAGTSKRDKKPKDADEMEVDAKPSRSKPKKPAHEEGSESEEEQDEKMSTASKYRPGGKGIHRNLGGAAASAKRSDHKKKGDKFEPYAYIPLRQKKGNQKVLHKTIQKTLHRKKKRSGNS